MFVPWIPDICFSVAGEGYDIQTQMTGIYEHFRILRGFIMKGDQKPTEGGDHIGSLSDTICMARLRYGPPILVMTRAEMTYAGIDGV